MNHINMYTRSLLKEEKREVKRGKERIRHRGRDEERKEKGRKSIHK